MSSKFSHEEIKTIILNLEQVWPVQQWRLDDVDIWPYIRIKLYYFLLNYGEPQGPKRKNRGVEKIKGRKLKDTTRLALPFYFIQAFFQLTGFFKSLKPKKILFFGSHIHRTKHGGVYFNRFFDAMVDCHSLQDEVYLIEFQKVFDNNFNQAAVIPLHKFLNSYKFIKKMPIRLKREAGSIELKDYDAFYSRLCQQYPEVTSLRIAKENLKTWASKVNNTTGFFERLYRKTQPTKIIFLSYYGFDDLYAAILAANKAGIKTIDFQHGPQTNVHMAYSHWTKHPKGSFNIMPLEYWNWDRKSKENIDSWAKNVEGISAKVVGHPYLGYCLSKKTSGTEEVVFYSLQTMALQELFPPYILEIIKTGNFPWLLRVHPRSQFTDNDLRLFLTESGVSETKYLIEDSMKASLPESLSRAIIHVTNFSGCLIEAQMMDVPTILIHKFGQEMFRNYIDNRNVYYLDSRSRNFRNNFDMILEKEKMRSVSEKKFSIINPLEI